MLSSPDPADGGNTPLHLAAKLGFVEIAVSVLVLFHLFRFLVFGFLDWLVWFWLFACADWVNFLFPLRCWVVRLLAFFYFFGYE